MTPHDRQAAVAEETCSGCQQPLTRRGPGGECLRCSFDFALSPDPDAGTSDENAVQALTSGALRYGHFQVAIGADSRPVELGAAMAVTYRGHDTILDRDVALKVIDQRLADHPSARARSLREARAAAQLHHPNIATVTHYGEQDGSATTRWS